LDLSFISSIVGRVFGCGGGGFGLGLFPTSGGSFSIHSVSGASQFGCVHTSAFMCHHLFQHL
jgi:hypothetical protein